MKKEDKIRQDMKTELDRLLQKEKYITNLEKELHDALYCAKNDLKTKIIAYGLGETDNRGEISELKAVIKNIEDQISEFPIIIEAINLKTRQAHRKGVEADRLERAREMYESYKIRLQTYSEDTGARMTLKELALRLEEIQDYEDFISSLDAHKEAA